MVIELAQGLYGGHIFPFQTESVATLDDHHDVYEIQAVDPNFFPGSIWLYEIHFDFKLLDQKTIDFPDECSFIHARFIFSKRGDKNSKKMFNINAKRRQNIEVRRL